MKHVVIALAALCAVGTCVTQANAAVILDQLPADVNGQIFPVSQFFDAGSASFNTGVIDDFSVGSATTLTSVSAALLGFGGFTSSSYSAISSYTVEIYSSVAAAAASLTGNVASVTLSPGAVTLTKPYTDNLAALVDIPVDIVLAAGSYWVAVIPSLSFQSTNGAEIGIVDSGSGNSSQVNPAGGFGFTGNINALGAAAAYRIEGDATVTDAPEPASFTLLGVGLLGLGMLRRRGGSST